ncbi:zinc-ribbon domain-containing protein [Arthrobacter oryzae]|uniref:zinc-ribbon domain-containing protein n=1 Tax=Arthrobacter oryzae TaxID=409290 RepID=UPI00142DDB25
MSVPGREGSAPLTSCRASEIPLDTVAPDTGSAVAPLELGPCTQESATEKPPSGRRSRQLPTKDEGLRSLAHLFPSIAAEWDRAKNPFPPSHVRPGSNRKIWWLCENGHSWLTAPYVRTKGHGCAACKGMKATGSNNFALARPDLLSTWNHERNKSELGIAPTDVLPQSNKDVWWTCQNDERHTYVASPAERFRGRGCPYCVGKRVDASNSVGATRPALAAEWDPANTKRPDEVSIGSDFRAAWICRKDDAHRWMAAVSSRPANGAGCPFCSGRRPTEATRVDVILPALALQWHPTKNRALTPADVTAGSNRRVWWLCPQDAGHVWATTVRARALDHDGCKWCAPTIRSSVDIALACEFAAVFPQDVDPKRQERLDLGHNRPHSVDILIKSLRIAIEFDGSYSHKGEAHEARDSVKTRLLREAGYRVVRIREEPLPLLDPECDVSVEQTRAPDAKAITNKVLRHLVSLSWVAPEVVAPYLESPYAWADEVAAQIYESLPESERFVPLSAKAARKRRQSELATVERLSRKRSRYGSADGAEPRLSSASTAAP